MDMHISQSVKFPMGNQVVRLGPMIEKGRTGKNKYLAYIDGISHLPGLDAYRVYLYLDSTLGDVLVENHILYCTDVELYLKGDKAALVANKVSIVGEMESNEPETGMDDIQITDFIPNHLTDPSVPAYKIPPHDK